MNILDTILNAQNGGTVRQIGQMVGLEKEQTTTALAALLPALGEASSIADGNGILSHVFGSKDVSRQVAARRRLRRRPAPRISCRC